jgi:YVTN family beta-propeller protein
MRPFTPAALAVGAAAIVLLTFGVALLPRSNPSVGGGPSVSPSAAPSSSSATSPTPPPAAIVGEFDAGGAGWAMTNAGGALWIQVDPPVDAIVRIDVATGTTAPAVPGGWQAKSGNEGLWIVGSDWLARVDPATGQEVLRVPIGGVFALADGAVWLLNDDGLHRIDASTGTTTDPVGPSRSSVCDPSKDLIVAFDSAWLSCKEEGTVARIDLATGAVTSIPTAAGAERFTVADGAVWVTNVYANSVSRIDPETNRVTTVADAGSGHAITSGDGYVWVGAGAGIAKIDPATNSIVDVISLGSAATDAFVWDEGIIWVSTRSSRVLKVDPTL